MTTSHALRLAPRFTAGILAAAVGGWLLLNTATYRDGEAWSTARVVQFFFGNTYHHAGSTTFYVGLGGRHPIGLNVTSECSTAAIAAAILLITGLLVALTRIDPVRAATGMCAAVALVTVVNVGRLLLLSWSASNWGVSGWFEWLHVYGGSFLTILAVIAAIGVYLRFVRRGSGFGQHRS